MPHALSRLLFAGLVLAVALPVGSAGDRWTSLLPDSLAAAAQRFIDKGKCPCRCGNYLPGSTQGRACFGCSVGKAEVSRIVERLAAGAPHGDVLLVLGEPVLISVFADYTDTGLADIWQRVKRVAAENDLHRVVLRTPARTESARMSVALAEYARSKGRFFEMQRVLVGHAGPWDARTLGDLAGRVGLSSREAKRYLNTADVRAQVEKDRQHARLDGIAEFPIIKIGNEIVEDSEAAISAAIRRVLLEDSM